MGSQVACLIFVGLPVWGWYRELATRDKGGRSQGRLLVPFALAPSAVILTPSLLFFHQVGVRVPLEHFVLRLLLGYPLILVVAFPCAMGFALLQRAASPELEGVGGPGADEAADIADQLHLQALLRRFLAVLGGILTLAVLGVGALFQAYNAYNGEHRPELDSTPQELLLVLGGIWAGVVAARSTCLRTRPWSGGLRRFVTA